MQILSISNYFKNKKWVADILVTTICSGIIIITLLLTTKILANNWSLNEFGYYSVIKRIANFLACIIGFGTTISIPRFLGYYYKNKSNQKICLFTGISALLIISIFFLFILFFFHHYLQHIFFNEVTNYFNMCVLIILLAESIAFQTILFQILKGYEKLRFSNLVFVLCFGIFPFITALIADNTTDYIYLLFAFRFLFTILPLAIIYTNSIQKVFTNRKKFIPISTKFIKYSFPRMFTPLITVALFSIPPIFTMFFFSAEKAAYFEIGILLITLSDSIFGGLNSVMVVQSAKLTKTNLAKNQKNNALIIIKIVFIVFVSAIIHLQLYMPEILKIWVGEDFLPALSLIQIISISILPYAIFSSLKGTIEGEEEKAVNTRNVSISLLTLIICLFSFYYLNYNLYGIAYSILIGYVVLGLSTFNYTIKRNHIALKEIKFTNIIVFNLILIVLLLFLKPLLPIIGFLLINLLLVIGYYVYMIKRVLIIN